MITWQDFEKVDMRVGTIVEAADFPEARDPAYQLKVDFGSLGVKKSSAQITKLYKKSDLVGKQVIAVINFPPKQVTNFVSECLVLGVVGDTIPRTAECAIGRNPICDKEIVLLQPERKVANGYRIA